MPVAASEHQINEDAANVSQAVYEVLQDMRLTKKRKINRRKRVDVGPGKGVRAEDLQCSSSKRAKCSHNVSESESDTSSHEESDDEASESSANEGEGVMGNKNIRVGSWVIVHYKTNKQKDAYYLGWVDEKKARKIMSCL